ncbi:MAG TPA: hypothetical protein VGC16_00660 [Rhizomicrobium sp.]
MSVYSPVYHAIVPSPAGVHTAPMPAAGGNGGEDEGFFHHILDIVNPLQHLPVVGTIYRAITGEHIGVVEQIAGDALYGGLWGAVSSVAGVAFQSLTGKSVEDTALAWLKGDDSVAVAGAKVTAPVITADASLPSADLPGLPAQGRIATATAMPQGLDVAALTSALSAKGVDNDTATRALYAYRRSMGVQTPLLASAN